MGEQENPATWDYRVPVCSVCRMRWRDEMSTRDVDVGELVIERCSGCFQFREDTRRCAMPISLYAQCNRCGSVYAGTMGKYLVCACTPNGTLCENRGMSRVVQEDR